MTPLYVKCTKKQVLHIDVVTTIPSSGTLIMYNVIMYNFYSGIIVNKKYIVVILYDCLIDL
jgi:hypothetical protein